MTNLRVWAPRSVFCFSRKEILGGETDILARDGVDHIVWGRPEEFRDDGELVDVVLAWEERLALEHLGEDATGTPDVDLDVILLPGEHDLGCTIVPRRDVAGHLRILNSGEAEVADLQVAVLVDQDVAGFQVSVDDAGGVDVFQAALGTCQLRLGCYMGC